MKIFELDPALLPFAPLGSLSANIQCHASSQANLHAQVPLNGQAGLEIQPYELKYYTCYRKGVTEFLKEFLPKKKHKIICTEMERVDFKFFSNDLKLN